MKRGTRWAPSPRDIDPIDLGKALPHVILLDVVGAPPRFRKRLVGTAIVAKEGHDTTGRWLDETVRPDLRDEVLAHHVKTVATRAMTCYAARFWGQDGQSYEYQRLLLPLSADGERVDRLFGGAVFGPDPTLGGAPTPAARRA